jgi:hypothetical protein
VLNTALLHIILVHIPVIGTPLLVYLGWKAIQKNTLNNYKAYYWSVLILSVLTSVAYFTGPQTAEWIKTHLAEYPQEIIEDHALWGRFVFIGNVFSGILALMAVLNYVQNEKPHKSIPWILLIVLGINFLLLVYTVHLGGMIRRPDLL